MLTADRFALNRIAAPRLSLPEFLDLAVEAGLRKVELRNDLADPDPVDGLGGAAAARLADARGVRVITLNALQKFNLPAARDRASAELDRLLEVAVALGGAAVVLCPNNAADDVRPRERRVADTAEALAAFGPRFKAAGVLGYVEPLGFAISSLASLLDAQAAIRSSGAAACYRIVHDTFHHHIGPDAPDVLGAAYDVAGTGLVHVSGVEAALAREAMRDEHRLLVGPADALGSRAQVQRLDALGYRGDFSFEPFAPEVQALGPAALVAALKRSVAYLSS